ncbi:MAG: cAMP-binding protein [Flavobacteriaceae bacterium]|nr:MAG: cAMP-binding protein [Flavobacteriaceae bacterium]
MKEYLESFHILSTEEIEEAVAIAQPRTIKKNDFLSKEGTICTYIAFVESGILRTFYHSSSLEEITYCFSFPGTFTSSYSSFITQEKSMDNIQSLTDVSLMVIPKHEIDRLEKTSINWMKLLKVMAEQSYINLEKRIFMLQKEKAEVRYQNLLAHNPELLLEVPLNYLASYLGITQRHLSRIRKALTN